MQDKPVRLRGGASLEVGAVQGHFTNGSFRRAEAEHPRWEFDREGVDTGDESGEDRKRVGMLLCTRSPNTVKGVRRWRSRVVQDLVELVSVTEIL